MLGQISSQHEHLLPPFCWPLAPFTAVQLNMLKDCSTFDFFELKEIYQFMAPCERELPIPYGLSQIENTEQSCKERMAHEPNSFFSTAPQPSQDMIAARREAVRRRKEDVQTQFDAYELERLTRDANNFY
jgi:hypothetical protein